MIKCGRRRSSLVFRMAAVWGLVHFVSRIRQMAVFFLLSLAAGAVASCDAAKTEKRALPLQVEAVRVSTSQASSPLLTFPIIVQHARESDLSARIGGVVQTLRPAIGDEIPRDYAVATIEAQGFRAGRARILALRDHQKSEVLRNRKLLGIGAISASQLDSAVAELRATQAALAAAEYDLQSTIVKMPYRGVVLSLNGQVGEVVLPGKTIMRVADIASPLVAKAKVPTSVAMRLVRGQPVIVTVPGVVERVTARVLRIGRSSDRQTATVDADLLLPAQLGRLASGTVGSASFEVSANRQESNEQRVPVEALLDVDGDFGHIYTIDSAKKIARRTRVRIIKLDGDWLKLCCLNANTAVITNGAGFVENGQRVDATIR
jgi:membrane fusion protein, multidrug efflux system